MDEGGETACLALHFMNPEFSRGRRIKRRNIKIMSIYSETGGQG